MSYPPITIHDCTPFNVDGTIEYLSWVCSDDGYKVSPGVPWTSGRRPCLVVNITATVHTPDGDFQATLHDPVGPLCSQFAIVQTEVNTFIITCIAHRSEDQRPEGYVEPTTEQK